MWGLQGFCSARVSHPVKEGQWYCEFEVLDAEPEAHVRYGVVCGTQQWLAVTVSLRAGWAGPPQRQTSKHPWVTMLMAMATVTSTAPSCMMVCGRTTASRSVRCCSRLCLYRRTWTAAPLPHVLHCCVMALHELCWEFFFRIFFHRVVKTPCNCFCETMQVPVTS